MTNKRKNSGPSRLLLCIDLQNDFVNKTGKLSVHNAEEDLARLCTFIKDGSVKFKSCIYTLDTHNISHIGNAENWVYANGDPVKQFTQITNAEVRNGNVKYVGDADITKEYIFDYISELYNNQLCFIVWNSHCIKNTMGAEIPKQLTDTVNEMGLYTSYVHKGLSDKTEFYSAIEPVNIIEGDKNAQINTSLLDTINSYDEIYVTGQAYDYCVMSTLISIAKHIPEKVKDVYILTDTTSPISVTHKAVETALRGYGYVNFVTTK
ncbi:MAG: hypothetical protein ACRDD8_14805 [Bacteroidales bacterium]